MAEALPPSHFTCEPDTDNPGWLRWKLNDTSRFNEAVLGKLIARAEGPATCRVRMQPQHHHTNSSGNIHGAVALALADISLFAAISILRGVDASGSATVDLSMQFIGAGNPAAPLDAVVEVLRETRRLGFLRGLVVQDAALVASFSGTVRKPTAHQ